MVEDNKAKVWGDFVTQLLDDQPDTVAVDTRTAAGTDVEDGQMVPAVRGGSGAVTQKLGPDHKHDVSGK